MALILFILCFLIYARKKAPTTYNNFNATNFNAAVARSDKKNK